MILGELAGITIAALMQQLFNIAKDWNTLVAMAYRDPEHLVALARGVQWCVSIFFTCFNLSHWILAFRYWKLSHTL